MIAFFFEDIKVKNIGSKTELKKWVNAIAKSYNLSLGDVNYIFCSDPYLLKKNQDFLQHDYYTDIITFNYNEDNFISGDLFISYDRVKDNAKTNNVTLQNELYRVMAHGILHLCGLNDKTKNEQQKMREAENKALALIDVSRGT